MGLFDRKKAEVKTYDAEKLKPVLRCSICTGEQTAGFKELKTGKFIGVQLIRNQKDLDQFMAEYGLGTIEKEY